VAAGIGAPRLHDQPGGSRLPRRCRPRPGARGRRGARVPRRRTSRRPRTRRDQRRCARRGGGGADRDPRGRSATKGPARGRDRDDPHLDRTRRPRAPAICRGACSSWAAAHRCRDRPGLRQVRCADGDRAVGRPAPAPRPPAQQRSGPLALEADGVRVRLGVRALRARAAAGADGADVVDLDDGSTAEGHAVLLAVGRTFPVASLGSTRSGSTWALGRPLARDGRLRIADGVYLVGDAPVRSCTLTRPTTRA